MTGTAGKDGVPTLAPIPKSRDIAAEQRFAELARNRDRDQLNLPPSADMRDGAKKWTFWRIAGGILMILIGAVFAIGAAIYIVITILGLLSLAMSMSNRR